MRSLLLLALLTIPTLHHAQVHADETPSIAVGQARIRKTVIAFAEIKTAGDQAASIARSIKEIVNTDLTFMDMFRFLSSAAFIEPKTAGITPNEFKLSDWNSIGTEFLIKSAVTVQAQGFVLEAYLYDVRGSKQALGKRYMANLGDAKTVAHTLANDIVSTLTGLPGIFLTKIAMSCDRNDSARRKEIYMMNFDGTEVKQITRHRSISFSPAWNADGTKIAYSVYTKHRNNIKNIDLWEFDFVSGTVHMLSNKKGINSGAAYAPQGKKMALTMSFLGNPEVFELDLASDSVRQLTHSLSLDVDPTWSPDGRHIAFVSDRAGGPMVYSMNSDGSGVQRLTYAGRYNASPTWSPQNNKIAFAGWLEKNPDIFIMNPDGTNIERLTKGQGSNEDPYFSPDGEFLVFSSNRTGQKNIYVMNVDGTFVKRLTFGLGNCDAPKWSSPPQGTLKTESRRN